MSTSSAEAPAGDLVRLRRLEKWYGRRRALAGIDLVLDRHEIVGVVGPDGAGKTTLLRALVGLLEIRAEEATVLGYDLRGDVTDLKRAIGYVPQTFSLHRELSVIENLRFTARLHRLSEAEFAARSGELLERTALAPFAERLAGALSGGMKQKLAIANALLIEPALIVLDEPTAGVDVVARTEIWGLLERERSRALVLLSTSYLDEAAAADRLVYLDGGRVLATGSPAELRTNIPLELFRAWGDEPKAIARRARELPYVVGARVTGGFARIEVGAKRAPDDRSVIADLRRRAGARFAVRTPVDMESVLLALSRHADHARSS